MNNKIEYKCSSGETILGLNSLTQLFVFLTINH